MRPSNLELVLMTDATILKIKNRSENWKTARSLSRFFEGNAAPLAYRLGEPRGTPPTDVKLELFWKGVRDYRAKKRTEKERSDFKEHLVNCCRKRYSCLREEIIGSRLFKDLNDKNNYRICSNSYQEQLFTNLLNTEIDIVLETPGFLYIGEAKFKSNFDANGNLVLVHQLIRQYVMATALVDALGCSRESHSLCDNG